MASISSLIGLLISVGIAYWVYTDAQRRGMQNSILWAIGAFLLCIIVLPIYLIVRPKDPATL